MNEDILGQLNGPPQGPTKFRVGKIEPAQRTYFYKQPRTGKVFAVGNDEAWNLFKKGWEQIGCSDGSTYAKAVAESHEIYNAQVRAFKLKNPGVLVPEEFKQESLELAKERLKKGFDEELSMATGNIVEPTNADYYGDPKAVSLIKP